MNHSDWALGIDHSEIATYHIAQDIVSRFGADIEPRSIMTSRLDPRLLLRMTVGVDLPVGAK